MFGRRRKDVDVVVVADGSIDENVLGEAAEPVVEDRSAWAPDIFVADGPRRRGGGSRGHARALAPRVSAARAAVSPYAVTTRNRLAPAVAGARDRVVPAVAGARETLVGTVRPAVTGAMSTAVAAARESRPDRSEGRRRTAAALAALRGELPPRQRRGPVALISLLVGAAAGAAAGFVLRRAAAPSEPSYLPASAPASTPPPPRESAAAAPETTVALPLRENDDTPAAADEPTGMPSGLGWPEQSGEPFADSDLDAVIAMDDVDQTLADDSSETHKPTA
ncbi:MAG: hypothetical protein ACR2JO_14995 [Mycobacteriales bacterium]